MSVTFRQTLLIITYTFFVCSGSSQGQAPLSSQTSPLAAPSSTTTTIGVPVATGVLGKIDAAATALIKSHQAVVGSSPWIGMQASGTLMFAGTKASYPATLSNLGAHNFRLDTQTAAGQSSIRIRGVIGEVKNEDGTVSSIAPDSAMLGLFPFQFARHVFYPTASISTRDHGVATIDGNSLHQITFELPAVGRNPATKTRNTVAVDLYFDPVTQLLVKSVTSSTVPNARNVKFLFVVTYGDYRLVGTSMIPFLYTETMQGQPYRTLQLSQVKLDPALSATYFEF